MSPEDRAYLDGLRDDLCARHGFTWRDVVHGEQTRRLTTLNVKMQEGIAKVGKAAAAFVAAFENYPKGP